MSSDDNVKIFIENLNLMSSWMWNSGIGQWANIYWFIAYLFILIFALSCGGRFKKKKKNL